MKSKDVPRNEKVKMQDYDTDHGHYNHIMWNPYKYEEENFISEKR